MSFAYFILFIVWAVIIGSLLTVAVAYLSFAPWVPTWGKDLERIFKIADLRPGEIFYDLGAGNGRVAIYASQHTGAKIVGIELAFPFFLVCKFRQLFNPNKNLSFKFGNLFKEDLSQADVVYIYGLPATIKNKLKEKFEKELKPGARVVSYVFSINGWTPEVVDKPNKKEVSIYLYRR